MEVKIRARQIGVSVFIFSEIKHIFLNQKQAISS